MKGLNTSKLLSHPDLYLSMNEHWIQSGFGDLMSWFLPPSAFHVYRWKRQALIVLLTTYFETRCILWLLKYWCKTYKKQMQMIHSFRYGGGPCLISNIP